jgi:pyrimidine-nucleoside phosphorylase
MIDEFARLRSDEAAARLVAHAEHGFDPEAVGRLAQAMARSGVMLDFGNDDPTADLASTGAPSSLSTLLGPLYLCLHGLTVPKLGVPGRPAGGIDILAQVPDYKIRLTSSEVYDVVARCGYAHFLADETFAPLDAALFRYRVKARTQHVPGLVSASLIAKKIACGIRFAGVDVRVAPHGNFGRNFDEAAHAARALCAAARAAGIKLVAILTDARTPYQPFIGRGEALLAISKIFTRQADPWLAAHDAQCRLMAAHVVALVDQDRPRRPTGDIVEPFARNLAAQGSSMDAFWTKVDAVEKAPRRDLVAPHEGFLSVDLAQIRSALVAGQSEPAPDGEFLDEQGLILQAKPGAYVRRADLLASIRTTDLEWAQIEERLTCSFYVTDLLDYVPGVEEIITAG